MAHGTVDMTFCYSFFQELHRVLAATAGAACSGILSHPSLTQNVLLLNYIYHNEACSFSALMLKR